MLNEINLNVVKKKIQRTHLCVCTCASSCRISDEIVFRKTDMDMVECLSGLANA